MKNWGDLSEIVVIMKKYKIDEEDVNDEDNDNQVTSRQTYKNILHPYSLGIGMLEMTC